jgi:hypothetical protein
MSRFLSFTLTAFAFTACSSGSPSTGPATETKADQGKSSSGSTNNPGTSSGGTSSGGASSSGTSSGGASSGGTSSGGATSSGGTPDWGAAKCSGSKEGFAVGQSLADLAITDCDTGAPASLDDVCGASGTWIFAAHTHCPTCRATAGFADEVAAAVASKNVAVVQLVYNDSGTTCAQWREAYKLAGIPNVRLYEDPNGAAFAALKTSNYTAISAFLDKNHVVTFKEHGLSKAQVLTQIDAALAR